MKQVNSKSFLCALALGGMLLGGCREDETLDLVGYPSSTVGITIADTEDAAVVELKAVYDGEGKIGIDGPLSQKYLFTLDKPSTEDVVLKIEPVIVNIPNDKVEISAREIRIPAGAHMADTVYVNFLDPDFSFAEPDLAQRTYELGVKIVAMQGTRIAPAETVESKVVVNKTAYVAGGSIAGEGGREIVFKRSYWDGKILNEEKMEYAFKAYLDRPASEDVKVTFASEGLEDRFAGDAKVTPAALIIPAGAVESTEEAIWTLTDDFLLATDQPEEHSLRLVATFESADPTVAALEEQAVLTFDIKKAFNALALLDAPEDAWTAYDRTGWTATGEGGGYSSPQNVLDGGKYSDYYGSDETLMINIDMQEVRNIEGIGILYYDEASEEIAIEISEDGTNWTELGTMDDLPDTSNHYVKILSTMKARYVKFTSLQKRGYYHDISEIDIYRKN